MSDYIILKKEFLKEKQMKSKLRQASLIFFVAGLFLTIMALIPRAMSQAEKATQNKPVSLEMPRTATEASQVVKDAVTIKTAKAAQVKGSSEMVEVTCYTPAESHGANGREYGVSAATYRYPQGTWIYIDGIGKRRVDTVTAKRLAHRVDVWMTPEECEEWGKQLRKVTVL